MAIYKNENLREMLEITKALGDENRLRILMMLQGGELCVCQINEVLGLAQSTVSKHLSILKQARLIESRKKGRWIYYRRAEEDSTVLISHLRCLLDTHLQQDPRIKNDEKALKQVRQLNPEHLCQKQHPK